MSANPTPANARDCVIAEVVVVGAGVVGLAIARQLAIQHKTRVLVLETQPSFGLGTSGRNSEVIHAGIYYPPSSLKARLCVRGNRLLYEYLAANASRIRHRRCGKLLLACTPAELDVLESLYENARRNGVELVRVTPEEVARVHGEPNVRCVAGLWSPSSGILDVKEYMACLERDILDHGGAIWYNSRVIGGGLRLEEAREHAASPTLESHALLVQDTLTKTTRTIHARCIVNAAGLYARAVSLDLGISPAHVPRIVFAKGNYFKPQTPEDYSKFSGNHLVYPIPVEGGLGIHATIDVHGGLRFGPDVEWVDINADDGTCGGAIDIADYTVNPNRMQSFQEAISRYYMANENGAAATRLTPAYSGLRPKAAFQKAVNDFVIESHRPGFVALYGIESPGLTASLAIAEEVASSLIHRL